jgi:glycerol kinase
MRDSLCLAIDQGTHASRALVVDRRGRILARGEKDVSLARPQPDWAEQDGDEIVASIHAAIAQAVAALGPRASDLAVAGLSSQRASAVCWDRASGRPLSPIFSWQDRRMHAWIDSLQAHGDWVHRKTGLYLSPHYGASKLRWALDHLPAVRQACDRGTLAWGPMVSFLACCRSDRCWPIRSARRAPSSGTCTRATGMPNCSRCSACRRDSCR